MCEIDYCDGGDDTTLTVDTQEESLTINFCLRHSIQIEERLTAVTGQEVDLRDSHFGTIGELNEAIDYVDAIMASKYEMDN